MQNVSGGWGLAGWLFDHGSANTPARIPGDMPATPRVVKAGGFVGRSSGGGRRRIASWNSACAEPSWRIIDLDFAEFACKYVDRDATRGLCDTLASSGGLHLRRPSMCAAEAKSSYAPLLSR